jgi:hypothetical protein
MAAMSLDGKGGYIYVVCSKTPKHIAMSKIPPAVSWSELARTTGPCRVGEPKRKERKIIISF